MTTNTEERQKTFRNSTNAVIVENAIIYGQRRGWYYLIAYVVMPDHMHLLVAPRKKKVPTVMHILKGFTAREINRLSNSRGSVWQDGYVDFPLDKPNAIIE